MRVTKLVSIIIVLFFYTSGYAAQPVTVILDWFINPDHAPLVVAQQQGYFAKQGLAVKLISPADPNDGPKLVAAGKADLTIGYVGGMVMLQNSKLPLMRVGTLIDQPLAAVMALKISHINSIKDLKGKKVGSSDPATDHLILAAMLKKNGLSINDITLISVHYNLVQALLSRQVDAVTGIMRNVEPIEVAQQGYQVNLFFPEDNGVPTYDELVFIANKKSAHALWVKKFLIAVGQGNTYLQAHPDAAWQQFAKAYPEANNAVNQASWFKTLPYFAKDPAKINYLQQKKYVKFLLNQHTDF